MKMTLGTAILRAQRLVGAALVLTGIALVIRLV